MIGSWVWYQEDMFKKNILFLEMQLDLLSKTACSAPWVNAKANISNPQESQPNPRLPTGKVPSIASGSFLYQLSMLDALPIKSELLVVLLLSVPLIILSITKVALTLKGLVFPISYVPTVIMVPGTIL